MRWVALGILVGCAPEEEGGIRSVRADTAPPGCEEPELALVPGTGELEFTPIDHGDEVALRFGPAGGAIVVLAGQVSGASSQYVQVTGSLLWVAEDHALIEHVVPVYVSLAGWGLPDCIGTFFNLDVWLTAEDVAAARDVWCALDGEVVVLTITVVDPATGRSVEESRAVVIRHDETGEWFCGSEPTSSGS